MSKSLKVTLIICGLVLAAFTFGALIGASTADAKAPVAKVAVSGFDARNISKQVVRNDECGRSWWWNCSWVSNADCRGGGGGTWHCYLRFSERHRVNVFSHRTCDSYVWVGRWGNTSDPSRYNC